MIQKKNKFKRVALVTESLWGMGGANRVLEVFATMFPDSDIFALFGEKSNLSKELKKHKIYFSSLNRIPNIKNTYRHLVSLWPYHIESFDLSNYDLVISSSSAVAHGVVVQCKHVAYIHSPMRYLWDLGVLYKKNLNVLEKLFLNISSLPLRVWDTTAGQRADIVVANSTFVRDRISKYWGRDSVVLTPPVARYAGEICKNRKRYFVAGAPFQQNKGGEVLLDFASKYGFKLKVLGEYLDRKSFVRKYKNSKNIEFLGYVSESKKWDILSKAAGYIMLGIEDYGIFACESLLCGTPILAYGYGGILDIVNSNNSVLCSSLKYDSLSESMGVFLKRNWDYVKISKDVKHINTVEDFKSKFSGLLVDSI